MRVKVNETKHVEIRGRLRRVRPGQIVDVGKGLGKHWIRDGSAIDLTPKSKVLSGPLSTNSLAVIGKASKLILSVREFWFNNCQGTYDLCGYPVSRNAIQLYGGPNPEFNACERCQHLEWKSRLVQQDLFVPHQCSTASLCKTYCERQGQDEWTHFHQNFWYAAFVDSKLNAAKCVLLQSEKDCKFFWSHHCDQATHVFLRQFAQICQVDTVPLKSKIDVSQYDFAFIVNSGIRDFPPRYDLPILMYGHDLWKRRSGRQRMLDYWKPDYFWTPFLSSWKAHYNISKNTELVFRPVPASMFFTRSNLDDTKKKYDLLCIGATGNPIYQPRIELSKQLAPLQKQFRVLFHHQAGASRSRRFYSNRRGPYANAWSEFLGSARYIAFAGISEEPQPVFFKYYEVLGSGAIPIMPNVPDLKLLGVEPWVHFIPLSSVWKNNAQMHFYLDHYDEYKYIAENAVAWHQENADKLLFDGIEDLVQEITKGKYPRRLY